MDKIKNKEVRIIHCPTEEMIADFNTKPLQGKIFYYFRNKIMGIKPEEYNSYKKAYQEVLEQYIWSIRNRKRSVYDIRSQDCVRNIQNTVTRNTVTFNLFEQIGHARFVWITVNIDNLSWLHAVTFSIVYQINNTYHIYQNAITIVRIGQNSNIKKSNINYWKSKYRLPERISNHNH